MQLRYIPILLITLLAACDKAPAPSATKAMEPMAAPAAPADLATGEKVFKQVCFACHGPGVNGAPRVGNKSQWDFRVEQGKDVLYKHAHEGFKGEHGVMPPRGGKPDLTDAELNAAVDYMLSRLPPG